MIIVLYLLRTAGEGFKLEAIKKYAIYWLWNSSVSVSLSLKFRFLKYYKASFDKKNIVFHFSVNE